MASAALWPLCNLRRANVVALGLLLVFWLFGPPAASADTITVGVFAPSAPFPSTANRVELASRLGEHIGKALGGTGTGKVFARAGDFQAAVKSGEIKVALVDATYLASQGGYTVIASGVRGGETQHGWQLVARSGIPTKIGELKGKRVILPSIGGRETDFVLNVMFGGEVPRDHFSKIEAAPDTASALAALGLGRADLALVPTGTALPAGATVALTLPAISGTVLVAYGTAVQQRGALVTAATSFSGDATVQSFKVTDGEGVRAIAKRFGVAPKKGVLAVPAARLVVGDLLEGRTYTIERASPTQWAVAPK